MRKLLLLIFLLSISLGSFAHLGPEKLKKRKVDRYVIWVIPSLATNIYGIAIGPIGSETICHSPYPKKSHGINIQIGQGLVLTFGIGRYKLEEPTDTLSKKSDSSYKRVIHNGILVSVFGTLTNQINGISLSSWMSMNNKVNGLSINPLWNLQDTLNGMSIGLVNMSRKTSGIQLGIYNKTLRLRGFQFGLWNVNERRSFPIINWNFKKKKNPC
jgi:hypothetical protein